MRILFLSALFFISFVEESFAYLDPGSGMAIIQIIIAFFASIGATIILYWRKFKNIVSKVFKKKDQRGDK